MPFDADAISRGKRNSNELIPAGTRVTVRIESAVEAVSQAGNKMVEVRLRVDSGPHAGASIFERHTMTGKGAVYLADLSRAVGCLRWQHASELERRTCELVVTIQAQEGYETRNRVGRYVVTTTSPGTPEYRDTDVPF